MVGWALSPTRCCSMGLAEGELSPGCNSFQTHIHIIDRRTRKPVLAKYHTDPMVVFHHVNAYEEDGCLLFDVIAYEDGSLYQLFYLANLNEDFKENSRLTSMPTLKRFVLPLHVDKVTA